MNYLLRRAMGVLAGALMCFVTFASQMQIQAMEKDFNQGGTSTEQLWCQYDGFEGPGKGKHIVLIAGDDEYRSEQTMPMLGKILAVRFGFKCTVLFPIDPKSGEIVPSYQKNIPGMEMIDSADLVILGLRFRDLPDEQMKHFVDYVEAGSPIIGTRTSTHAFNFGGDSKSSFKHYGFNSKEWKGGFGQQILGDTWINHHGRHKSESCRGVIVEANKSNPILKGVTDVWGPSDVYGIRNLPKTATVLLDGAVLAGMTPDAKPVEGSKNNPMMPIAWVQSHPIEVKSASGSKSRIFCTTMGASTDFESEGLRRLIVNASFWCLGMEKDIPEKANVNYVDDYKPTAFGFGTFEKGTKPEDYNLIQK
jgi:hypothetical protein